MMTGNNTRYGYLAALGLATAAVIGAGAYLYADVRHYESGPALEAAAGFREAPISLALYDLYDLGVVDVDSDGDLDVFTTNHSARQSLLVNDGSGRFDNRLEALGLGQDRRIAGLEDATEAPDFSAPGLYVYRQARALRLVSHRLESPVEGTLSVPWPMVVLGSSDADYQITESGDVPGIGPSGSAGDFGTQRRPELRTDAAASRDGGTLPWSTIRFTLAPGGRMAVNGRQDIVELPHRLQLSDASRSVTTFFGREAVEATADGRSLWWRDRHSMAWHDVDDDGEIDVFIGRGGVKGRLGAVPVAVQDELMLARDGGFVETSFTGLEKSVCPGRQAAWVDVDGDGRLDLHVSCGRHGFSGFSDQLFQRTAADAFVDRAADLGLDHDRISVFEWFDVDGDGDQDLVSIEGAALCLYVNAGERFVREVLRDDLKEDYSEIAAADFDGDGDIDAFAASRRTSLLLLNEKGALRGVPAESYGLPAAARSASWVDVDNDGRLDFHSLPGGIYRPLGGGRFEPTREMGVTFDPALLAAARCSWFDADGNGTRDVLCAIQRVPPSLPRYWQKIRQLNRKLDTRFWSAQLFLNDRRDARWLQLDLHAGRGNAEALGARVRVTTDDGEQFRHVGYAEGSHYGQGHHRLYFGLGSQPIVRRVDIDWPDGTMQILENLSSDQRLEIRSSHRAETAASG